jgi:hypothetical protein
MTDSFGFMNDTNDAIIRLHISAIKHKEKAQPLPAGLNALWHSFNASPSNVCISHRRFQFLCSRVSAKAFPVTFGSSLAKLENVCHISGKSLISASSLMAIVRKWMLR